MKVEAHWEYPISVDELYALITSKAFFEQRFAWGKVDNYRFERFEDTAQGKLIKIAQPVRIRTDKIPAFARKLLPQEADLITEFLWYTEHEAGEFHARYRFELGSVPMTISGEMRLVAVSDERCAQHTMVEVSSSLPLVGKKLVGLVSPKVEDALEGDHRQTLRYVESRVGS